MLGVLKDHKTEILFWLDALSNSNIDERNKELINRCLEYELNSFLYPIKKILTK